MLLRDIRINNPVPIRLRIYDRLTIEALIEGYQSASYGNDECNRIESASITKIIFPNTDMSYLNIKSTINENLTACEIRFFPSRFGKPVVVCIDDCGL